MFIYLFIYVCVYNSVSDRKRLAWQQHMLTVAMFCLQQCQQSRAVTDQVTDPGVLKNTDKARRFLDGLAAAHERTCRPHFNKEPKGADGSLRNVKADMFEISDKGRR